MKQKHRASILLNIEVHPLKDQECTGYLVSSKELARYDLKPKMIINVDGENLDQCLQKVRELINATRH